MDYIRPFGPKPHTGLNTANGAIGATSSSIVIIGTPGQGYQSVKILATGNTGVVFINFTVGAGTAIVTSDMPIVSGIPEVLWLPKNVTNVNLIGSIAGGTLYVTTGEGI